MRCFLVKLVEDIGLYLSSTRVTWRAGITSATTSRVQEFTTGIHDERGGCNLVRTASAWQAASVIAGTQVGTFA